MKKDTVNKILAETEAGYDLISTKFSQTRKHFWRGLEFLKDYTQKGDKVFDFGCGNGRLLELIGDVENVEYYGADISEKLIEIAKKKYGSFVCHSGLDAGSMIGVNSDKGLDSRFHGNDNKVHFQKISPSQDTLPFENDYFNTVYSIAVFHHFPSKEYREKMAHELYRITKPSGHVAITVWCLWPAATTLWRGKQKKYFRNILKNWSNKLRGDNNLDWNDCMISFTDNRGNKFNRFHHAFTKRELKKLFESVGFEIEKCEVIDEKNIVLIGKKL